MYAIKLQLSSVHHSMSDDYLCRLVTAVVEGMALVDAFILSRYPDIQSIYNYRPRYYVPKKETWKDVVTVIKDGTGDCKDFVAWRLAEIRKAGYDARAETVVAREGRKLQFHVFIRYANGQVEDPARELGMR